MKYVHFSKDINETSLDELITSINSLPEEETIILYLCSGGGSVHISKFILHMFNTMKDRLSIVVSGVCHSSALDLILSFEGPVRITPFTHCTAHIINCRYNHIDLMDKNAYDSVVRKDVYVENKELESKYEYLLTKKEMKRLRKGADITLSSERVTKEIERLNRLRLLSKPNQTKDSND